MNLAWIGTAFRGSGGRVGALAVIGLSLLAAACSSTRQPLPTLDPPRAMYGAVVDDTFLVAAVNLSRTNQKFLRQVVDTPSTIPQAPGSIVIDPANRFLYLELAGGKSMRYGIGVGREGFAWSGEAVIRAKQHWPKWQPPAEMVARDPRLKPIADGEAGGPANPLGARAMYLWADGQFTLYRIHGTNAPSSIGKAVSSGCIRMFNQDVIDLYERVPAGTKVIVLPSPGATASLTG
jgi:lipoprotein-anchoring transpeptidase ErfK/SrfK